MPEFIVERLNGQKWEEHVYVQELIRCKNCKHFELNHWDRVGVMPIITCHEICTKWGDGCKTDPEGFCFLAERKDNE